mmetsp:Transcript_26200/g.82233  ORF Transcript_26200/g.82233 Transcript_26200/m.82233 type:complete len:238 (+) Transcript_26200:816-1529(+)
MHGLLHGRLGRGPAHLQDGHRSPHPGQQRDGPRVLAAHLPSRVQEGGPEPDPCDARVPGRRAARHRHAAVQERARYNRALWRIHPLLHGLHHGPEALALHLGGLGLCRCEVCALQCRRRARCGSQHRLHRCLHCGNGVQRSSSGVPATRLLLRAALGREARGGDQISPSSRLSAPQHAPAPPHREPRCSGHGRLSDRRAPRGRHHRIHRHRGIHLLLFPDFGPRVGHRPQLHVLRVR